MSVGLILLAVVSALVLFGAAQRVLDKMRLTDRQALLIAALLFLGGLIPNITFGQVEINLGGAVVPFAVCVWLLVKAGTRKEFWRTVIGSVLTAVAVYFLGLLMPNEPEQITLDPNYAYGLVGGAVAYILGRSRRGAFVCGVLGVMLADIAVAVVNWSGGVNQRLVLGGAGAFDAIVISGIIAVLLSELVGEIIERVVRRDQRVNADPIENPVVGREKTR